MKPLFSILILILSFSFVNADLVTYPQPTRGDEAIAPSPGYSIRVKEKGGEWQDSFVYYSIGRNYDKQSGTEIILEDRSNSWTSFSFEGDIEVEVTNLQGAVSDCVILPRSYNIRGKINKSKNSVTFTMSQPGQVSVEFNGKHLHSCLVFANPLEINVPSPDDENVHYFGPGIHDIGLFYGDADPQNPDKPILRPGDIVYIAGGAWINGSFSAKSMVEQTAGGKFDFDAYYAGFSHDPKNKKVTTNDNVTIKGRGVVSGINFPRSKYPEFGGPSYKYGMIRLGNNSSVEGITVTDPPAYTNTLGRDSHIDNVKCLAWYGSTDAYAVGDNCITENSFSKVHDDHTKARGNKQVVKNNVYFLQGNGAAVIFSYNATEDTDGFIMKDCDILHADDTRTDAVFEAKHGGGAVLSGLHFENLRIDGNCTSLFGLALRNNQWASQDTLYGKLKNITFKNISIEGKTVNSNWLWGRTPDDYVENVTFEDFRIGGRTVSNIRESKFAIGPYVKEMKFIVDGKVTSQETSLNYKPECLEILIPAADGTVRSDKPDQTYGIWRSPNVWMWFDWEELRVGSRDNSVTMESYMRFEGMPDPADYKKAYLCLFGVANPGKKVNHRFEQINQDNWEEVELTWTSSRKFQPTGLYLENVYKAGMNQIDITKMAKQSEDGRLALKISSLAPEGITRYNTKESNTPFMVFMR